MGGNSPSHLHPADGEFAGLTLVEGIRLSDRVIKRMRQKLINPWSPSPSLPLHADSTTGTTTTPIVPSPSVKQPFPPGFSTGSPPPPQEATTARGCPPSRVTFHSPTSPEEHAPAPPTEPAPPPAVDSCLLPPAEPNKIPLPPVNPGHPVVPASPPPLPTISVLVPPTEPILPPSPVQPVPPSKPPPLVETVPVHPELSTPHPPCVVPVLLPPAEPSSPPPVEPFLPSKPATPPTVDIASSNTAQHAPSINPPVAHICQPPSVPSTLPPPPVVQTSDSVLLHPAEPLTPPPCPSHLESVLLAPVHPPSPPLCSGEDLAVVAPTHEATGKSIPPPPAQEPAATSLLLPDAEEEVGAFVSAAPSAAAASVVNLEDFEKDLRQKIKEEMERELQGATERRRAELQLQLKAMQAETHAAAESWAAVEVAARVKAALKADEPAHAANISKAIAKERHRTEDERLTMQLYAHQLEEKEKALKERDALYKERIAKLQVKCTQFYKTTAESFQKGKEDAHRRFARFNIQPVCGDMQSQVLKCYQENPGKSLSCSRIASAYMQCVEQAKKSQPSTAG
ncbi:coiled-coil-helix-coiled-coil-helix domain containing 3b isoform X2 [Stigmatopora argus]